MKLGKLGARGGFASLGSLGGAGTAEPPTAFALTDIASGRLFQRTKALTTGPVSAAGTYSGGTPNAIELQVLLAADDSVVKGWTTATGSIAGGNWSAAISGVGQGGPYYVKARPANATGLAKTGSNSFYVGILIVMYGQSNMAMMSSKSSSPPAATAGTTYYDGSAWAAVPVGNGVREMLNAVTAATSVPCAALNGSVSGVPIATLAKGQTAYTDLAAQITSASNDFEFIVWHQGEGDSGAGTSQATYIAALGQLHSDLVADYGRTKAQAPLILAGLGNQDGGAGGYGTDASWDAMQRTLLDAPGSLPSVYYSHSNRDITIEDPTSFVHWDAASYGRAGKRYARSISTLLAATSGYPNWHIASSAVVDATTTTVDVTQNLGTDFTPTTGITGFDISGDNGGSWSACTGVRTSATQITLTHASVATDSQRKLRYQYGFLPDISGIVLDNSALALPLDNSASVLSPTPLATLPVPSYQTRADTVGSGAVQSAASLAIGAALSTRLVIVAVTGTGIASSAKITPSGGSDTAMTLAVSQATTPVRASIWYAIVPTATTATFEITYTSNPFLGSSVSVWTVDSASMSSTTPVDTDSAVNASAATLTVNLTTSSGGFVIAAAASTNISTNSATWNANITERFDATQVGKDHTGGDASNTAALTNAFEVTPTFVNSGGIGLAAVSWR